MAYDKTEPQNQMILIYSALAVAALFGLKFVFDAYMDMQLTGITQTHLNTEQQAAANGHEFALAKKERVMKAWETELDEKLSAASSRLGSGRPSEIVPQVSRDFASRKGWALLEQSFVEPPVSEVGPREGTAPGTLQLQMPTDLLSQPQHRGLTQPAFQQPALGGSGLGGATQGRPTLGGSALQGLQLNLNH